MSDIRVMGRVKIGNERAFQERLDKDPDSEWFSELLGFEMTPADREALSQLSRQCCFRPRPEDAPVQEHWDRRRDAAEEFLKQARSMIQIVENLGLEETWIQTRFQFFSTRDVSTVSAPDTKQYFSDLYDLRNLLDKLSGAVSIIRERRKPTTADETNYYVYVMAACLKRRAAEAKPLDKGTGRGKAPHKRRGAGAKRSGERRRLPGADTQIYAVVATYIRAWKPADPELRNLDAANVADRVRRFDERNHDFANLIDRDPRRYLKEETGLDFPAAHLANAEK